MHSYYFYMTWDIIIIYIIIILLLNLPCPMEGAKTISSSKWPRIQVRPIRSLTGNVLSDLDSGSV